VGKGARVCTGARVESVVVKDGTALGVNVRKNWQRRFIAADLVILAAGGLGTPVILKNSGIDCEPKLFVDPVLCVAAECPDVILNREIIMPFVVQQEHFIISPYFDYLSFFFNREWRIPASHVLSLMIKLADENTGDINRRKINKELSDLDRQRLQKGIELCTEILLQFGVKREKIFLGTVNAGHPGGMVPLTHESSENFHSSSLPQNMYVADATLFPRSLGNPPILTVMAMAKRVSRRIINL
jgi:choline dehydrogenase-like flavoprotein